jgi:hypothetical protein
LLEELLTRQRAHLAPVPAFDKGQRAQAFLAARQLLQQHIGRDPVLSS